MEHHVSTVCRKGIDNNRELRMGHDTEPIFYDTVWM